MPDTDRLLPLARALHISVDELLSGQLREPEVPSGRPLEQGGQKEPSWLALHWYWVGLIPVAWGCYQLITLLIGLASIGLFLR